MPYTFRALRLALLCLCLASVALAQEVVVGVVVSSTGPAASLGIPQRDTFVLLEEVINAQGGIAGHSLRFEILDDASDTTQAVRNARSLIEGSNVVAIIGSTTTPASLGMIDVVSEVGVSMISLGASKSIIYPVDEQRHWVFKSPQTDEIMAEVIVRDMLREGISSVAFIGFNDAYGEGWWNDFSRIAEANGLEIVASERYARTDTSVAGQVLRIISSQPEAVLIGASGTPAVLPQRTLVERGFSGLIYQTHGVANPDFLRVGGEDVEGTRLPAGPMLVVSQLPEDAPTRAIGLEYVALFSSRFGDVSTFGAHAFDAWLILEAALERTLAQASPDDLAEFRSLLRDEIAATQDLVATHGIFSFAPDDHLGLELETTAVMVTIENGTWQLLYTLID